MKIVIALMLGLVAGTASFAQASASRTNSPLVPQTHITMTADQKIKFHVSPVSERAQIALQDADGHALYTEYVTPAHGFDQQFDVSGLAVGTYRLTLTTNEQTIVRTFVVQPVPNQTFIVMES